MILEINFDFSAKYNGIKLRNENKLRLIQKYEGILTN